MSNLCKNCNSETTGSFCAHCGQSTTVRRIDWAYCFKDFIFNNLTLHKGILHTIKALLLRPKTMVQDYLNGKRMDYTGAFHFLILILIIRGIVSLLVGHVPTAQPGTISINGVSSKIDLQQYIKPMLYIFTSFSSLGTYLVYKKSKFRLAEHFFLNFYIMGMVYFLAMIFNLVTFYKISQYTVIFEGLVILSFYIRIFYDKKVKVRDFFKGIWCLAINLFFALILLIIGAIIYMAQHHLLQNIVQVS